MPQFKITTTDGSEVTFEMKASSGVAHVANTLKSAGFIEGTEFVNLPGREAKHYPIAIMASAVVAIRPFD